MKIINDLKIKHESLKNDIIIDTNLVDELTIKINEKLKQLEIYEQKYIKLIEILNNK